VQSKVVSLIFLGVGHIALVLGAVGIFVPLLPTTPFVLLAAWCYSRGSPRLHALLRENKYFGTYVREWEAHHIIPVRAKALAVTMIAISIGYIVYAAPILSVKVGMAVVGLGVSAFILTRPSRPPL
jgi:uncharacterized membrane protein YbaN (DUF454 family)